MDKSSIKTLGVVFIETALIVMGSYHVNDCPAQSMLPIYLIFAGISVYLSSYLPSLLQVPLAWAGYVWVNSVSFLNQEDPANYCYQPLYLTAYWVNKIHLFYVVYPVIMSFFLATMIVYKFLIPNNSHMIG